MKKSKRIALAGILSALVFVAMLMESVVLPRFSLAPPAMVSIPVMLTVCMLGGFWYAIAGCTVFGLCSFACGFITGWEPFMNPLISILPRLFIGPAAYGVCTLIRRLTAEKNSLFVRELLPVGAGAGLGVVTNTVLVLTMMSVFYPGQMSWAVLIGLNFFLELAASIVLTPILNRALRRALRLDTPENHTPKPKREEKHDLSH